MSLPRWTIAKLAVISQRDLLCVVALFLAACASSPAQDAGKDSIEGHRGTHQVRILDEGFDALVERVEMIRGAKSSIDLQTFIWSDDEVGRLVLYELLCAAERGVRVRALADQMFSENDAGVAAFAASAHENLSVRVYNPVGGQVAPSLLSSLSSAAVAFRDVNQRMHNKLMVADGSTAITGGRNLENAYFDCNRGLNYRDREVYVGGSVVDDMHESFESFWNSELAFGLQDLEDVADALEEGGYPSPENADEMEIAVLLAEVEARMASLDYQRRRLANSLEVSRTAFLSDLPGKNHGAWLAESGRITEQFVKLVGRANERILIQSPYLVLSERGMELFEELSEKGVTVGVSTNSLAATDNWTAYGTFHQQKRELLRDLDMEVFEFRPTPLGDLAHRVDGEPESEVEPFFCLHAKSIVVDEELGCIGSYNLDPRSANLNTEVALLVWDEEFTARLESSILADMQPDQSWVLAARDRPILVKQAMGLLESVNSLLADLTTLDLLPSTFSSCYELEAGESPVSRRHPDFYENYNSVGSFPGLDLIDDRKIKSRLMKSLGGVITPLL